MFHKVVKLLCQNDSDGFSINLLIGLFKIKKYVNPSSFTEVTVETEAPFVALFGFYLLLIFSFLGRALD